MKGNLVKCAQKSTNKAVFGGLEVGDYVTLVIAKTTKGWYEFLRAYEIPFNVTEPSVVIAPTPSITVTHDYVTVTWDAVEGASKYTVKIVGNGETIYRAASTNSVNVYGLEAGTEYEVSINAKIDDAYIGYGEASTFETPAAPQITLTSTKGVTRYTLSWDEVVADKVWIKCVVNGTTTQYEVVTIGNSCNVPKTAAEYYIVARVLVDGVYKYVTSNTVTIA